MPAGVIPARSLQAVPASARASRFRYSPAALTIYFARGESDANLIQVLKPMKPMEIAVDCNDTTETQPLEHYWSLCVGAGRANEGLRAAWQQQLRRVVLSCGFRYIRFHGLFHDDMFVYREVDGTPVYTFDYIDELFDSLLRIGIRPFVELGFCPPDLATERGTVFWWKGNGSPPKDMNRWNELVERTVKHWIGRYGIEEVRNWYFEVWNEPNISVFFRGTQEQYFELYRNTVTTIKRIDEHLRVGGPATSNFYQAGESDSLSDEEKAEARFEGELDLNGVPWLGVWIREFLDFLTRENLPCDFISTHPYPTIFALDTDGNYEGEPRPVWSLKRDLLWVRDRMSTSPYRDAQLHCTEWNTSPSPVDHTHDYLQAATYVVRSMLHAATVADSVSYWVFSDIFEEQGAPAGMFHGGFGMLNRQGIAKPVFHAFRFLNTLGDREIRRWAWGIATRDSRTGKLSLLAYNYPDEITTAVPVSHKKPDLAEKTLRTGSPRRVTLTLSNCSPGASFVVETLDEHHGNAPAQWRAMGAPAEPTLEQLGVIRRAGEETKVEAMTCDENGELRMERELSPWAVMLVREL